jgi:flagellar FliL protein
MATAAATADEVVAEVAPTKGKKKLIIIIAASLLLLGGGGGGAAFFMMKKKAAAAAAAAAEEGGGEAEDAAAAAAAADEKRKHLAKHPPVFVPLEPFVVNLADKEADRFAQIGVTLEVSDPKFAEQLKAYMPAIRNGILMVLAHKTSAQLLSRDGKLALAREIAREAVLPLGIEPTDAAGNDDEDKTKKHKDGEPDANPLKHVHFSNFIVQ